MLCQVERFLAQNKNVIGRSKSHKGTVYNDLNDNSCQFRARDRSGTKWDRWGVSACLAGAAQR